MKPSANLKLIGFSILLAVAIAACEKPGPAETAGRKIDQAVNDAGNKMEEVGSNIGEKLSDQSAKTGVAIDDAEITARVKAAIFAEPGLKTLQIGVDTIKGEVTLSGSVDSRSNSDRAAELAGAVAGVKHVENRLELKSAGTD